MTALAILVVLAPLTGAAAALATPAARARARSAAVAGPASGPATMRIASAVIRAAPAVRSCSPRRAGR